MTTTPDPAGGADGAALMIGCVFVGTSLDGFIARENGDFDWLTAAGDALGETGYDEFFASVDAMVVGRATFDTVSALPRVALRRQTGARAQPHPAAQHRRRRPNPTPPCTPPSTR